MDSFTADYLALPGSSATVFTYHAERVLPGDEIVSRGPASRAAGAG